MNLVALSGYIGKEPDLKYSKSGMAYSIFSLATSDREKGEEKTDWHSIVCFGKTAEFVGEYVHKGDLVEVEGKIKYETWEKDGVKRVSTKIVASRLKLVKSNTPKNGKPSEERSQSDEDIPF